MTKPPRFATGFRWQLSVTQEEWQARDQESQDVPTT